MNKFVESCDSNNPFFKHILNKYFVFLIRKYIKPYLLDILAKYKIVGYIRQDMEKNIAYPSIQEGKGILPIRLVESHFFQSQNLFNDGAIDFLIKDSYLIRAQEFLSDIPYDTTPVFVHVRRGDYINEVYMGEKGLDLPRRYYIDAINIIEFTIRTP